MWEKRVTPVQMAFRCTSASLAVAIALVVGYCLVAAPAEAFTSGGFRAAKMHGTPKYPDAGGKGTIYLYARHAEVYLERLRDLPRRPDTILMLWLADESGDAYAGGAFPRRAAPHGLTTIVPGRNGTSRDNAKAAERLVLTSVKRSKAVAIGHSESEIGWDRRITIQGQRVMTGRVRSLPPSRSHGA